ncbi:MAG: formylmethanofuran dehydrogenase subunit E family protein [bacterium]|nr:formylmethanofuran dehydrogenase subunit E family protein [bacterium]
MNEKKLLNQLIQFHGHLGPYLVLGYRMGAIGLRETNAKKYFGVNIAVHCPNKPPVRCLIDGLQFATGATYGKANICITKFTDTVKVVIKNTTTKKTVTISFNPKWYQLFKQNLTPDEEEMNVLSYTILRAPEQELFRIKYKR